jgi:hypothetical protein
MKSWETVTLFLYVHVCISQPRHIVMWREREILIQRNVLQCHLSVLCINLRICSSHRLHNHWPLSGYNRLFLCQLMSMGLCCFVRKSCLTCVFLECILKYFIYLWYYFAGFLSQIPSHRAKGNEWTQGFIISGLYQFNHISKQCNICRRENNIGTEVFRYFPTCICIRYKLPPESWRVHANTFDGINNRPI